MRKVLISLLTVALLISNVFMMSVCAVEQDITDKNQLLALAKETFPEFSDKIAGMDTPSRARSSDKSVAVQLTRNVDSNTTMTYTEYNNGLVTLGAISFDKKAEINVNDSVTHSTYEEFTATIVAYVVEGPTFTATNVKYRIYPTAYDKIISVGNYSIPGYTDDDFEVSLRGSETASQFACASYEFVCPVGGVQHSGGVYFKLQGNVTSVEFKIW